MRELDGKREEWTQSEEWRAQKAEGERRKWAYEQPTRFEVPKGAQGLPVILPTQVGRPHSMDEVPPLLYLEGPSDLASLKRELADLDRDIEQMIKHETVIYKDTETEPE